MSAEIENTEFVTIVHTRHEHRDEISREGTVRDAAHTVPSRLDAHVYYQLSYPAM